MDCKHPQRQGTNRPANGRLLQTHCPVNTLSPSVLQVLWGSHPLSSLLGQWQLGHFCWMTWTSSACSLFGISHQTFSPCIIPKYFLLFLILYSRLQPPSGQAKLLNLFLVSLSAVWTNILAAEGSEVSGLCAHERCHGVHAKETG